jgi:uncharacterized protein YajQ (UPF0234 family)
MAGTYSFDVTTGCDLQEVDNAVNQAAKEVAQRFDFWSTSRPRGRCAVRRCWTCCAASW